MQIKGCQVGEGGGGATCGDERGSEGGSVTPFFTPQHLAASQPLSRFSLINSQDSLDVYHDAYASLQRNQNGHTPTRYPGGRKRHASVGGGSLAGAAGRLMELNALALSKHENGISDSENGMSNGHQNGANTPHPHHIGRLSLSTNSLKKKPHQSKSDNMEMNSSQQKTEAQEQKTDAGQKTGDEIEKMGDRMKKTEDAGQKMGDGMQRRTGGSTWVLNYRPCVEMGRLTEQQEDEVEKPEPATTQNKYEKLPSNNNNDDDIWRRNYVACVDRWACVDGGAHPQDTPTQDTVVHMYSFGPPVQNRGSGIQQVRDEFRRENIYLQHKVPHLFVTSQWQEHNRMSCMYLGYRLFWSLYFTMWAIWAWVGSMGYDAETSLKFYFLLYLTNWSIWTLAADTTLQAINVIMHFKKISEDGDGQYPRMSRAMKISWVLSNIMGAVHLFITCSYWITVFPHRNDEKLTEIGINTHIMPGVYVLLDSAVCATPRRLLHAYQPALYVTAYTIFNLMYYLCGGLDYMGRPALYPSIDWTRPGTTIGIMLPVIFILIPLLHAFLCLLYAARIKMWRILKISRYVREDGETDQVDAGAQEQKV